MTAEHPPGVRYTLTAGPADVGFRVVLRRRLPDGRLTDVLGVVEHWGDGRILVRTRDGRLVEVAEADLVAGKRIPPAVPRR